MEIISYGRGGATSSGNWHVHYTEVRLDYRGKSYVAELTQSFFTKRAMLDFVEAFKQGKVLSSFAVYSTSD